MSRLVLLSLVPALVLAQQTTAPAGGRGANRRQAPDPNNPQAQAQTQTTDPADLCSLDGQVVNAQTGEPLRKANIILNRVEAAPSNNPPPSYSTTSAEDGHFAMKDIEPGQYRLMAIRNGYVTLTYGAKGPGRVGTTLSLVRQQHLSELTLKLTPHGVIAGRIVDEDGDPVANARVMLQSFRYVQGRKQLSNSAGWANTNDLGEYRVFGVPPGKYFLSITSSLGMQPNAMDRSATAPPEEDYVATYYPGTIDPSSAVQLEIGAGAQLRGIDLRLIKTHTVHVRGHVTHGLGGHPNVQVMLSARSPGGMMGAMRSNRLDPAGNFDIRGVSPGAYNIVAVIYEANHTYQAKVPIEVGSSSVHGINLVVGPGMTIRGHIRAEGNDTRPALDLSSVRLNLQPRELSGIFFGGGGGKPDDQGVFEIANVIPDIYRVSP